MIGILRPPTGKIHLRKSDNHSATKQGMAKFNKPPKSRKMIE